MVPQLKKASRPHSYWDYSFFFFTFSREDSLYTNLLKSLWHNSRQPDVTRCLHRLQTIVIAILQGIICIALNPHIHQNSVHLKSDQNTTFLF